MDGIHLGHGKDLSRLPFPGQRGRALPVPNQGRDRGFSPRPRVSGTSKPPRGWRLDNSKEPRRGAYPSKRVADLQRTVTAAWVGAGLQRWEGERRAARRRGRVRMWGLVRERVNSKRNCLSFWGPV
jgi:hypothetical protein